jgi:hypothetical protein
MYWDSPRKPETGSKPAGLHLRKRLRLSRVRGPPHRSMGTPRPERSISAPIADATAGLRRLLFISSISPGQPELDGRLKSPAEPMVCGLSAGGSRIHVTQPRFREDSCHPASFPANGKFGANGNRHYDDAGRLPRYRWFESTFLQRGVRSELLIDAAPFFAGSASLR